jgi:hypothetical protein
MVDFHLGIIQTKHAFEAHPTTEQIHILINNIDGDSHFYLIF